MSRRDDPPTAAEAGTGPLPAVEPGDGAPAAAESRADVDTESGAGVDTKSGADFDTESRTEPGTDVDTGPGADFDTRAVLVGVPAAGPVAVPVAGSAVIPVTVPAAGHESLRALWIQFAAVLVALAGLWSFLAFGPLSREERSVLSPGSLWARTLEHLGLTAVATVIVLALVLPLGLALTRGPLRRLGRPVLVAAAIGEGAPAIGLMVLLAFALGFGVRSSVVGVVACAVLPALRVFVTGMQRADTPVPAEATGPGDDPATSSRRTVPLPVLLTTVRTTLVVVVGAAALAAFTGGGGLGVLLTTGVEHRQVTVAVVGAGLVTLLAVVADWLGRFAEVLVRRRHPAPGTEPEV